MEKINDNTNRSAVSLSLYNLALDHHEGIICLTGHNNGSSSFALVRPQLEAYLRGMWMQSVATDEEIELFIEEDKLRLSLQKMANEVQNICDPDDDTLIKLVEKSKKPLHSLTHGGTHQVNRHFRDGETIKADFKQNELAENLYYSNVVAIYTGVAVASIFDDKELSASILYKYSAYK